jgi:glucokinase
VRRVYGEESGIPYDHVPEPKELFEIANGRRAGNQAAALEAFRRLGECAGDALGSALTLIDGLAVIGGGVSGAWPQFLPALVAEINGTYTGPAGNKFRRLAPVAFNLEDPTQLESFLKGETRTINVPGSNRTLAYDPLQRVGVGMSRLGTSEAVALGAYAFALRKLGPV